MLEVTPSDLNGIYEYEVDSICFVFFNLATSIYLRWNVVREDNFEQQNSLNGINCAAQLHKHTIWNANKRPHTKYTTVRNEMNKSIAVIFYWFCCCSHNLLCFLYSWVVGFFSSLCVGTYAIARYTMPVDVIQSHSHFLFHWHRIKRRMHENMIYHVDSLYELHCLNSRKNENNKYCIVD